VVLHHGKKDDSGYRDSTAIGAGVDMILTLSGKPDSSKRVITALGRFTISNYAVWLKGAQYTIGSVAAGDSLADKVLSYLRQNPVGVSANALASAIGARKIEVLEALAFLKRRGLVQETGQGAAHKWELAPMMPGNLDAIDGSVL
jgi:hypothetical protein